MFHTPSISATAAQAKAMDLPHLTVTTPGQEGQELSELHDALRRAQEEHGITGVISGAVASTYQATRVQKACHALGLWCFNPLWQMDQLALLRAIVDQGFLAVITAVAASPLDARWLGRAIDDAFISDVASLATAHGINPAGEGGEFESLVLDCPLFKHPLRVASYQDSGAGHAWRREVRLEAGISEDKQHSPREENTVQPRQTAQTNNPIEQKQTGKQRPTVLLISTCAEPLSEREFVDPFARIVERFGARWIKRHHTELDDRHGPAKERSEEEQTDQQDADAVIICGTALADNAYLEGSTLPSVLEWLRAWDGPLLGICAGMQLLGLAYGGELRAGLEIGLYDEEFEDGISVDGFEDGDSGDGEAPGRESGFLGLTGAQQVWHLHGKYTAFNRLLFSVMAESQKRTDSRSIIQAVRHKTLPHYGALFHPEVRQEQCIQGFISLIRARPDAQRP
ncbi:hypothetical protein COV94_00560 [Candidatus Woesearchaeota archaeon CG11_big_fil_rev_8_21_14_0_20_57_5]|nr:MAG: hypothetical protein COV94_00560 [Candidatus Woesearchaeota archaeon CG11_big_fil_rev_8_21_14_0_20_57_5]